MLTNKQTIGRTETKPKEIREPKEKRSVLLAIERTFYNEANKDVTTVSLSERKLRILQAIINDYVTSAEPVGSRSIAKKYELGVSPATIRNDMADLEESGYLTHPHTSAGRIPSDKAYRLYVDTLMKKRSLTEDEKRVIDSRLRADLNEFDETIRHAATILSEITRLTSFAMTPYAEYDTLRFIRLIPMDEDSVLLMIVSDSGNTSNVVIKANVPYTAEALSILSKSMTYKYKGHTIDEVLKNSIVDDFKTDIGVMSELAGDVMPNFIKTLENMLNVDLYMEGLTNIFNIPEYSNIDRAKEFLEIVSRKEEFMRDMMSREEGITVTIGDENSDESMKGCSLITATYHIDGRLVGRLGVIGPTRMNYSEITSIVEYVTNNISNTFMIGAGEDKKDDDGKKDD